MKRNQALTYIWVLGIGLEILYLFSMLPRTTGFAAADICLQYANDEICDDWHGDCGPDYAEGQSLDACDECQTGRFHCRNYEQP